MLRASSRAAPSSPTRQRNRRPTSGWSPSQPIRFALAPATVDAATQHKVTAPSKSWKPGQPILFGEEEQPARNEAAVDDRKGKGKRQAADKTSRTALSSAGPPSADTTRASISSSPRSMLANTTSSSIASWNSHRWDPPSPSVSLASHDISTSTIRFSPNRSYAQVGQLPRPSSPFGRHETSAEDLSVEIGSFSGAADGWGEGKVSIGVQAGTPLGQRRRREMSVVSPSSAVLAQPSMSQAEVDNLLEGLVEGIDFDDDWEMSLENDASVESFKSALSSPSKPPSSAAKSNPKVSLRSRTLTSPSPLSDNSATDLFSPVTYASNCRASSPILAFSFYPPSARAFSTTSKDDDLSAQEMMEALDEGVSDEVEIISRAPTLKGKGKQVVELDSDDDEVEIIPRVAAPLRIASSSSGWFTKPASLAAAPAPPPVKPKPAPHASARAKLSSQKARRAEQDQLLRQKYPRDFHWTRWGARRARRVYTVDEAEVERELAAMKGPVGFDLEWEPTNRRGQKENPTALAQVADEQTILLIHIARMKRFPPALQAFIEDRERVKLGVQIAGDARKLQRDFPGFKPRGLLELNNVARAVDPPRFVGRTKPGLIGLQELVGVYLDHYLSKESSVRCGKWTQPLNDDQLFYASNDVFSSLHVFLALKEIAGEDPSWLKHVSDKPSSASTWRPNGQQVASGRTHSLPVHNAPRSPSVDPSTGRRASLTPRERETYALWHAEALSVETIAFRMGIQPVSVVWNLLKGLSSVEGDSLPFDGQRLLDGLDEVGGGAPKMLAEGAVVLERVRSAL